MIGLKEYSALICNPSKCGTERLVRTLVPEFGHTNKEKHGWTHLEGYEKYVLIVRDPLERWVSTYWWIKGTGTYQGYRSLISPYMKSFHDFGQFVAMRRSKSFVFNTLDDYIERFKPDVIQRLEDLEESWPEYLPPEAHQIYLEATTHKTRHRKTTEETINEGELSTSFIELIGKEYCALNGRYGLFNHPRFRSVSS